MDGRWRSDGDDDGDDLLQFPIPVGDDPQVQGVYRSIFEGSETQFIDSTQGEPKNIYKP